MSYARHSRHRVRHYSDAQANFDWDDRRSETGPFDILGDIHGCLAELLELLALLGCGVDCAAARASGDCQVELPLDSASRPRRLIFVGDLIDRGPDSVGVLRLVMRLVAEGKALCLPGNHDDKLRRYLQGHRIVPKHGLDVTIAQLDRESPAFRRAVLRFLKALPTHVLCNGGKLLVVHAGLPAELQRQRGPQVRSFALYGLTTGRYDEHGLPERINWARDYHGPPLVVYGHTPVDAPLWQDQSVDIDTGCPFGGHLTALRYPELEIVQVAAHATYAERGRAFGFTR